MRRQRREHKLLFAGGGVGTGPLVIRFQIIEPVYCELCTADALVLSRPAGLSSVPEEDEYGVVHVHDLAGCWLRGANLDLVRKIGYATYLYTYPYDVGDPTCGPITEGPHWEVTSLCCTSNNGCS